MSVFGDLFGETQETDLSMDETAHLLRVERRRLVIRQLDAAAGSLTHADLAEQLASIRHGPDYDGSERKTEYVTLLQGHLPELAEQNVIEWDKDNCDIAPGPEFQTALDAMHAMEDVVA